MEDKYKPTVAEMWREMNEAAKRFNHEMALLAKSINKCCARALEANARLADRAISEILKKIKINP